MIEKLEINFQQINYSFSKAEYVGGFFAVFLERFFLPVYDIKDRMAVHMRAKQYLEEFLDDLTSNALKLISAITEHASRK